MSDQNLICEENQTIDFSVSLVEKGLYLKLCLINVSFMKDTGLL